MRDSPENIENQRSNVRWNRRSRMGPIRNFDMEKNGSHRERRREEIGDCGFIGGPPWVGTFSKIDGSGRCRAARYGASIDLTDDGENIAPRLLR